jgi:hypothetical protein
MMDGFSADVWLADLWDVDGASDSGVEAFLLAGALDGKTIHDGAKHAHVVSGRVVDADCVGKFATPDVASTDDDADLDSGVRDFLDRCGDSLEFRPVVNRMILLVGQSLPGEFDDYSFIYRFHNGFIIQRRRLLFDYFLQRKKSPFNEDLISNRLSDYSAAASTPSPTW